MSHTSNQTIKYLQSDFLYSAYYMQYLFEFAS
jgi:hypothetical protein